MDTYSNGCLKAALPVLPTLGHFRHADQVWTGAWQVSMARDALTCLPGRVLPRVLP